jgi:hypothetical protein
VLLASAAGARTWSPAAGWTGLSIGSCGALPGRQTARQARRGHQLVHPVRHFASAGLAHKRADQQSFRGRRGSGTWKIKWPSFV